MTERKPAGMPIGGWIEHQITAAEREGKFADLPGTGKPIPDLLKPETDLDYAAKLARREGIDGALFLPPALALAREVELLPERVLKEWDEAKVRAVAEDLNERIRVERLKPQDGPAFRARPVDVDQVVDAWQAARPAPVVVPPPVVPETRRRWWHRFTP